MRWPASEPSADSEARPSEISEMSVLGAAHVERHEIGNAEQVGAAPAAGNAAGRA